MSPMIEAVEETVNTTVKAKDVKSVKSPSKTNA
jgi:hypothetical protein